MTRWGVLLRNEVCGLLSDGNLGFLTETRYSRSGLYAGCSIPNFANGFVFVFPRKGDVLIDGLNGSVDVLGRSIEMRFGIDTDGAIMVLGAFCY